jgi:hypothetical protein
MKLFITKYALTKGIEEMECEKSRSIETLVSSKVNGYPVCFHKGEWHETRAAAVFKAEEMRKSRIASLKQQLKKLENMKFE